MSDDLISKAPAQDITSTDTDTEEAGADVPIPKIFDITPDLNISPAKDEVDNSPPVSVPENILGPYFEPNKQPEKVEEKVSPLQPQFGPANPPAKTVGINQNYFSSPNKQPANAVPPSTLQEAVSSIKIGMEVKDKQPIKQIPDRPWETKPDAIIKPLRTYETDFAEAMTKKRISSSSFVIAEEEKKRKTKDLSDNSTPPSTSNTLINDGVYTKSHKTRNWILGILSLIFILGGGLFGYYLYLKSPVSPIPSNQFEQTIIKSLIKSDTNSKINIDNRNRNAVISIIKSKISKPQAEKTINEIILTKNTISGETKITAQEMISLAEIPTPELFGRSLSSDWMLGIYASKSGLKHPFVILTNNFFQNAFAGLIQWEKSMPQDLKQYLYSSTNGDEVSSDFTIQGQFKDRIIKNRDIREYVAENGHILFLYSFISNDKLVISNNEEVLDEIIQRLEKNVFVR